MRIAHIPVLGGICYKKTSSKMAKFIAEDELNSELSKIFEQAEGQLIIISPYIKLHARIKSILQKKIENFNLELIVVYGKFRDVHGELKNRSITEDDLNFFMSFPNVEIRYQERLHAKYYANENRAIITSMNLYDFSQNTNIEAGILTKATLANNYFGSLAGDSIDNQAFNFFIDLIEQAQLMFKKEPVFESRMFGLTEKFKESKISENKYDKNFNDNYIDYRKAKKTGYCIRTGEKIKFNPERPYSYEAFKEWKKFNNPEYREKFFHLTGEQSNGETSFNKPILLKNLNEAKSLIESLAK